MHREWPELEWMRTSTTNEQCAIIKLGSVYNKEHKTYHVHHQTEIKTVRGKTGFLKFIWKLDFYELNVRMRILEIKCERNWNFENYLKSINYENWIIKIGNLGNHSKAEFLEINE